MANVLSFDKGAWDDKELINAYDASLLEFHIHNPGPGSWLDKATAALAKGQPLPGAAAYGSSWYTASKPPEKETRIKKRKKNPYSGTPVSTSTNPYSAPATASPQAERASSPTYRPASPEPAAEEEGDDAMDAEAEAEDEPQPEEAEEEDDEAENLWPGYEGAEQEWEEPEPALVVPAAAAPDAGLAYPPPRGHWDNSAVNRETALSYALNAQYWAGYWMGVAKYAPADAGAEDSPPQQAPPPAKRRKQSTLRR